MKYFLLIIFSSLIYFSSFNLVYAGWSTGFNSSTIQLLSPSINLSRGDNSFLVEGYSSLNKIWLCAKTPTDELVIYGVDVIDGKFNKILPLRFGPGAYTIWVSDNPIYFNGIIRFEIINTSIIDIRYLSPSYYVNSDNQLIIELTKQIITLEMTDLEKIIAIHNWVTHNISYDYNQYLSNTSQLIPANQTLINRKGVCVNYALLTAALSRASGLEAKIIYGQALRNGNWESHAWNEVKINNQWVIIDATWNAGFIQNNTFIFAPSTKYFNPNIDFFSLTHYALTTMNY